VLGLLKPDELNDSPCRPLLLNGVLYVKTSIQYLFAWGSVLIVRYLKSVSILFHTIACNFKYTSSIDRGRSFYTVAVLEEDTIATSFTSSSSGHYAVLVDNKVSMQIAELFTSVCILSCARYC
jgi:hypothetical protein